MSGKFSLHILFIIKNKGERYSRVPPTISYPLLS